MNDGLRHRSVGVGRRLGLSGFWPDVKLALRMLVKYPLLTLVGGAGMAFGIAAGVGGFEIRTQLVDPALPLPDGHRIVGIRNWDVRGDRPAPSSDADYRAWLEQIDSIDDLGAVALVERNLAVDGEVEPLGVAEMTASGFRVTRVSPLLGRTFVADDEAPGAPAVAVIGHELWQRRFRGDPGIIGRSVRVGLEPTTIVGVMPEDFGFPVAHQFWIPLRRGSERTEADARTLLVFGRLAPAVGLDQAEAEAATVTQRMALDAPDTGDVLRTQVVPYARLIVDPRGLDIGLALANIFLVMLIVVVCANVALLMFARAAGRESEIGVRTALGASRRRIIAQLFVEAVVLSSLSAGVGLVTAQYALGSLLRTMEINRGRPLPFWMDDSLTPSTIAYGVGLALLCAAITGIVPAMKVTGRSLNVRLQQFTAGGGGYRFGGVWTAVIATQVAVTVMFPATALFFHRWVVAGQMRDVGLPAAEYLSARIVMDAGNAPDGRVRTDGVSTAAAQTVAELRRRLLAEPGVNAVAFADSLPGTLHPAARFEVEGDAAPQDYGHQVRVASVDTDFFDALGAPVLSGRGFAPVDSVSGRDVAIVNRSFVEDVLRGRNAVGRRIRAVTPGSDQPPGPWIEIVGVASDLGMVGNEGVGLYRPLGHEYAAVHVVLHVRGAPSSLAIRLRTVASEVDPTLRVHDVMALDQAGADQWIESQYMSSLLAVLSGLALLLSLSAIYAVMAFTVVQRTREIGVRAALGADRLRIVGPIVRRPLSQIGLGIGAGALLVALAFIGLYQDTPTATDAALMGAYAVLMLGVCLCACVVPTRRALRLQPSQVLRGDG